ncbi:MAG TPA: hypothetical protein VN083_06770, partial [Vicinamibacteria bacterium]|nr:hypothetical protein [Vicinamibacteria bacterium]
NPGEAPSTGATSLLYTAYLGLAHRLGAHGEGLVVVAVLTGAILYLASVATAYRIGRLLAPGRDALLAAALVALGGPVVWGFLYGSDIALYMFLCLWLFERFLIAWRDEVPAGLWLPGCLLSLSRPEGLPIGLALGLAMTVRCPRKPGRILAWLPAATALGVLGLYRALTGLWIGTSVADKSIFGSYSIRDGVSLSADYLVGVLRGLMLGFYPPDTLLGFYKGWSPYYLPPLALLFVIASLARPKEGFGAPLRLWAALMGILGVLLAPSMFMGANFSRYLMWTFPILLVLTAVGLGDTVRLAARGNFSSEKPLFWAGASVFLASGVLATVRFAGLYGESAGEVNRRDVAAAHWIARAMEDGRLPPRARMADIATSVEYLSGHVNLNLHGVTSPPFFGNRPAEREAEVFEAFGRLPMPERPGFLISSLSAQETYPSLNSLVSEPPLFVTTSGSDEIVIYRMRYDLVGRNQSFFLPETRDAVAGMGEVDRLNVCDSLDEARHGYRYRSRLGDLLLNGTLRSESYRLKEGSEAVLDGGRAILGEESFRIRVRSGRDVLVVLRTASTVSATALRPAGPVSLALGFPEAGFHVEVDGHSFDTIQFHPRDGWEEISFRIPGTLIERSEPLLRLSGRYASFYYWFYQ